MLLEVVVVAEPPRPEVREVPQLELTLYPGSLVRKEREGMALLLELVVVGVRTISCDVQQQSSRRVIFVVASIYYIGYYGGGGGGAIYGAAVYGGGGKNN